MAGGEGECEREDALFIGVLQVPAREKGGCGEMKWGIERASGCNGFRGEKNSGPDSGLGQVIIPDRGPKEPSWSRGWRSTLEGRCPSRHDVIADSAFGFFPLGSFDGGLGNFKVAPLGDPFLWKMMALCWS